MRSAQPARSAKGTKVSIVLIKSNKFHPASHALGSGSTCSAHAEQVVDNGVTTLAELQVVLPGHEVDDLFVHHVANLAVLGGFAVYFFLLLVTGGLFKLLSLLEVALGQT